MRIKNDRSFDQASSSAAAERIRLRTRIGVIDDIVTRMTGKALPGQVPYLRLTPNKYLALSAGSLVGAFVAVAGLASVVTSAGAAFALAPVIAVTEVILVGRLRAQQVVVGHHAVHNTFCKKHIKTNRWIAEIGTLVSFSQNPKAYYDDHVKKHHRVRVFTSGIDPDAAFLVSLGFRPGMSKKALWRRFWRTLFSPHYHARFGWARVRANIIDVTPKRRVLALGYLGTLVALGSWLGPLPAILAIVLPLGPLYQMSALAQFVGEHRWLVGDFDPGDLQAYAERSQGRIALSPLPSAHITGLRKVFAWGCWSASQFGELLFRAGVTVGDLCNHDVHHIVGSLRMSADEWPQAAFQREAAIVAGDRFGLERREALGWRAALDWVFVGLSEATPIKD
jgi:Fatty acid desaturase